MNDEIIKLALNEDIGHGDASADLLNVSIINAQIISKEDAIICGCEYAERAFLSLDKNIKINWQLKDGDIIKPNQVLCTINGVNKAILSAERTALNFLQTLSATATQTNNLVQKIKPYKAKLLDTRKTIPGMRSAQKYAVKCGGGVNHRLGLYDCIMLKENHIISAGSITKAVNFAKEKYPNLPLIVEVENLSELNEALNLAYVDRILCDNFSTNNLSEAVKITNKKKPLEASGNINNGNIIKIAQTGVDYISIGSITKNIQAIDFSLKFI